MAWNGKVFKIDSEIEKIMAKLDRDWMLEGMRCRHSFYPFNHGKTYTCPEIKKVIFNDPATIVFWDDGSKTVVKVFHNPYSNYEDYLSHNIYFDDFDREKGVLLCIMKKMYGEGYYKKLQKWCE